MIIVDASALLELLRGAAPRMEARLFDGEPELHAPHLIDLEVAQALRRLALAGEMGEDDGRAALGVLADFPLERHRHDELLGRIWELRGNVTAYDAAYLALAEALDAPLVTCDRRLAAAPGHRARVEVF